jgi:hypothetical protein
MRGCYIWVIQHIRVFVLGGPRLEQCEEVDYVALCVYKSIPKFQAMRGHLSIAWIQVKNVFKSGRGGPIQQEAWFVSTTLANVETYFWC